MSDFVARVADEPADRERRTRHGVGRIEGGEVVEDHLMPWPAVVVLEASESDAMLFRYDALGNFGGDTWHESVDDAREAAEREYDGLISDWSPVPEGIAAATFAMDQIDWSSRPDLLRELWAQHEQRLQHIGSVLADRLAERDRTSFLDMVVVNEFGVAFDHLVSALIEQEIALTAAEAQLMHKLAIHLDDEGRWAEWGPLITAG